MEVRSCNGYWRFQQAWFLVLGHVWKLHFLWRIQVSPFSLCGQTSKFLEHPNCWFVFKDAWNMFPKNRWSEGSTPPQQKKPSPPYISWVSGEAKKQQWARFVLKNYEVPSDSDDASLLGRLQVCGGPILVEKMDQPWVEGLMSWFLSLGEVCWQIYLIGFLCKIVSIWNCNYTYAFFVFGGGAGKIWFSSNLSSFVATSPN